MTAAIQKDPRIKAVAWRDLLELPRWRAWGELLISLPWLAASLAFYQAGWLLAGATCSFFLFLTGLRQSHGAQHYNIGVPRLPQDILMGLLSGVMLTSMHAIQVTHLHHHRHCLGEEDIEASVATWPAWKVIALGPLFPVMLHRHGWRLGRPWQRRWIASELVLVVAVIAAAVVLDVPALRWHVAAMLVGECLTGFFAVWTVHHGCDAEHHIARTQRGWVKNFLTYHMFFHVEHHLFPAVPTCRLPELAERIDVAAPELREMQVLPH